MRLLGCRRKRPSSHPPDDTRVARGPDPRPADEEDDDLFNCPQEGCIKTFRTNQNLQRHIDFGRRQFKLHEESPYDQIRRKWAQHCISLPSYLFTASSSSEDMEVVVGWVLAKTRRSDRFSEQVRSILVEQFMIGEETGRKVTPVEAATRMRSLRDETGNRKFGKGAWLTPQQITSYFLRLAAMKKKKIGHLPAAIACLEEEDTEAVVERRDTISAKELTTHLPRCKFLCIFNLLFSVAFLHEHRKDKSLCRCLHC